MALYVIGAVAILASANALAHSYAGLYDWALDHRLGGWQAMSWPAEIDVFLVVGELALYVAYLDGWPARQKTWPWATALAGVVVSIAGNVGHIQPLPGYPVTIADRLTAAASPVAAFAGLTIGLLVLKMTRRQADNRGEGTVTPASLVLASGLRSEGEPLYQPGEMDPGRTFHVSRVGGPDARLLQDAADILRAAQLQGSQVSQRFLAARLRDRGHRFSNAQLRAIAQAIGLGLERPAA
jgi:hypothetical protein